ncbi:unnamed protein product [Zymoseptoria tritici ST99CH_1A5]|uniref:Uncharacterized protein n=1 Tax=Zymoseptoria tritici ST99CH_1A5 TaxID=1276529 RepID=A0A1Y6L2N6_ZYMTR|nr:unnamed protein product [Zymoseptoria tritici ST99CH_3D1]SMY18647.1 unnamed protein product [Zymoseptoria tritici ST99CH_1A5]
MLTLCSETDIQITALPAETFLSPQQQQQQHQQQQQFSSPTPTSYVLPALFPASSDGNGSSLFSSISFRPEHWHYWRVLADICQISNLSTAANSTMCVILWTRCGRRWCENAGYFTSPVVLSGCALRQRGTPHDACPAHREVHEEGDCRACVERRELEHLRVRAAAAAALQRALDAQLGQ